MDSRWLERVFDDCFSADYQTVLVGGGNEPVYLPSSDPKLKPHRIIYREDFFASALHEVAHWCLAGARRRTFEDYGYWYRPDGRTRQAQQDFERAEVDPQALEWIFSDACGFVFNLSVDNLAGAVDMSMDGVNSNASFEKSIIARKERYVLGQLPPRAEQFCDALLGASTPLRIAGDLQ